MNEKKHFELLPVCTVTVHIDRPLGSAHPDFPALIYPVNYGSVSGLLAPDGEEQDAYVLGVDTPVETFAGERIAVIHRADDVETKWVVVPTGLRLSVEQILEQVHFQEKFFQSSVVLCKEQRTASCFRQKLTKADVRRALDALPAGYQTAELDRLIARFVREKADMSDLRDSILVEQDLHRIYYYVNLKQICDVRSRMAFIHENLLFSDWWHTDQLISFVADLPFDEALAYARGYLKSGDALIRRWGYVLFISRLGRGHAAELLPLMQNDGAYYVRMAEAWLIAELAVVEPETVHSWMASNNLRYDVNGKAIQKICDSFRISSTWKQAFKALRPVCRARG